MLTFGIGQQNAGAPKKRKEMQACLLAVRARDSGSEATAC